MFKSDKFFVTLSVLIVLIALVWVAVGIKEATNLSLSKIGSASLLDVASGPDQAAKTVFTLNVAKQGSDGFGIITSNPAGINCIDSCTKASASFSEGTEVTLTAYPATKYGYVFGRWEGCDSVGSDAFSNSTCTVVMKNSKDIVAVFVLNSLYTLTVIKSGEGTVTSDISGINCGTICSYDFKAKTKVRLTAVPAAGYKFDGWSDYGNSKSRTIVMNRNEWVIARFVKISGHYAVTLGVVKTGSNGSGSITSDPYGINCPDSCINASALFVKNQSVILTATPPTGYGVKWYGCSSSMGNVCTILMNTSKTITATFTNASSITIISPNGGENIARGTSYTIRWHSDTDSARVVIDTLNEAGEAVEDGLSAVIANNEGLIWNVPNSIPIGRYKTKIAICPTTFSNLDCANTDLTPYGYDISDDYFNIVAENSPSVTILSPNGGETLKEGENYIIRWKSSGLSSDAKVLLRLHRHDDITNDPYGPNIEIVRDVLASQNYYIWNVTTQGGWGLGSLDNKNHVYAVLTGDSTSPTLITNNYYKIAVYVIGNNVNIGDYSDNYFSITGAASPCADSDGGEVYYVKGTTYQGSLYGPTDYCTASTLKEFFCVAYDWWSADKTAHCLRVDGCVASSDYVCPSGCNDGACINASVKGAMAIAVVASPTTPVAGQLVMGSSDNTFMVLSLTTDANESVNITKIIITDGSIFGGSLNNIKLMSVGTGSSAPVQIGSTVASLSSELNGKAIFSLTTPWIIPANTTYYLVVKAGVNQYPNAISGGSHILSLSSDSDIDSYGVSSGVAIKETGLPASSDSQDVYRTKLTVAKNASSPSGAQVSGLRQEVFRFDVAANANYNASLSAIAFNLNGSADMTGNGDAMLYNLSDASTPIKVESYKETTCSSNSGAALTVVISTGIPVGANVTLYNNSGKEVRTVVAVPDSTHITLDSTPTIICGGTPTKLYYRPLQPGLGKLYFGAHTKLKANISNLANHIEVASINGFAVGDKITFRGYNYSNQLLTGTATITGLSGDTIYFSGRVTITGSISSTIIANQLSSGDNARIVKHNSTAVVYEGTGLKGSIGQDIIAGTTVNYMVKGDTTGATTNKTLSAAISSAADFVWSDSLSYTINTNTVTFPVIGGNLTY